MAKNEELFNAICAGRRDEVNSIVQKTIDEAGDVVELLNGTMIPAMRDIGARFSRNEVYVPEMLIAARAMQVGLDMIEPVLAKSGHKARGRVSVGTVKGDLHDIGKNLVAIMLKGAGYEVDDLKVDCDVDKFKQSVENGAQAVLCSALLTTTMPYMREIADAFKDNPDVKVVVGGAPITQSFADEIGADGYGSNANDAVNVIDQLLGA